MLTPVVSRLGILWWAVLPEQNIWGQILPERCWVHRSCSCLSATFVSPGYPFEHMPIHRISLIISSNITQPYRISQIYSFLKVSTRSCTQKQGIRVLILQELDLELHLISLAHRVSVHSDSQRAAPATFCLWVFFGHWRWPEMVSLTILEAGKYWKVIISWGAVLDQGLKGRQKSKFSHFTKSCWTNSWVHIL